MSDTLSSKAYARLLDVLCEGPIGGLVDGARSIYLDGTAIQNADGSYNYQGITYTERKGTATQDVIPGFEAVENTVSVGVQIVEATPVTRTITDAEVDSVTIVIGVPILQRTDKDDGEVVSTDVRLSVDVQGNGGSWQPASIGRETLPLQTSAGGTTGSAGTNLLTQGMNNVGRASVRVYYKPGADGGNGGMSSAIVKYRLEYKATSSGTWIVAKESTMATVAHPVGREGIEYWNAETTTVSLDPTAPYEFRLTKLTDTAAIPANSTLTMTGEFIATTNRIVIDGISSSRYQRQATIYKPSTGAPWNIRVTRLTDDSSDSYTQNDTWWDSYTARVESRLRYPYSAAVAMSIDSEQVNSIPARGFDCYLKLIKIPSNYNPITRTYTGSWDGTFVEAWSDNPAWVFFDILTHPRYGLGEFIPTAGVDKWGLYTIAQYCDALVPDGYGGYEPRFRCNVYLSTRAEAYQVIQDLASVFRGMTYWSTGSIYVTQDAPMAPGPIYSPANVIDGLFSYSGSSIKTRHTVALVTWNDPADQFKQVTEYVEDRAGILKYGVVQTEVTAIACTSRGQAHRMGQWLLYSERAQGETVTFTAGLDTAPSRPGEIISVMDPARAGVRYAGRLLAASTTSVTLDAPVELIAGQTYTLTCLNAARMPQEATVTTAAGTGISTLALSPALAEAPAVGTMWGLSCAQVEPQLFRVLTLSETERHKIAVTAVAHDPDKFDAIELGLTLEPRSTSLLSTVPAAPTNLAVTEALYARGSQIITRLLVSWSGVPTANRYVVQWRRNGGAQTELTVWEVGTELDAVIDGQVYDIAVFAQNALGMRSNAAASLSHTVIGKLAPPADVDGFVVARSGETLNFTWRPVADVDAVRYEIRRGAAWQTGTVVASVAHPTNTISLQAPRGGSYMIKAVDSSDNYSAGAVMISAPDLSGINVVLSYAESTTSWTGARAGTVVATADTGSWDALTTWAAMTSWDAGSVPTGVELADGVSSGTYTTVPIDIGYEATSLVTLDPAVLVLGPLSEPWNTYTQPWSYYDGPDWIWQPSSDQVGASYEVSTSTDGSTWSSWAPFSPGAYRFRYVRFRVTLYTTDTTMTFRPFLAELGIKIDVPDRVLHFADQAVPSGGLTLSFSPAFVGLETVQVTLQGATVGDTYTVTGKSVSGVTINVFSAAGAAKAGNVDVDVFGYGER